MFVFHQSNGNIFKVASIQESNRLIDVTMSSHSNRYLIVITLTSTEIMCESITSDISGYFRNRYVTNSP
jgi:hypothetical protein